MKVPVEAFTADGRLHGASLHLLLLQMGWQRNTGTGHSIPIKDIRPWGICKALSSRRTQGAWHVLRGEALERRSQLGPLGWVLHCSSSRCTSKEELRDFPKLPK